MTTTLRRQIIEIDEEKCDGCGDCVPSCQEGAIQIIDGKARLVSDRLCDGLGACLGHCPRGAIRVIEREAEAFDEEAAGHAAGEERGPLPVLPAAAPPQCPGARMTQFSRPAPAAKPGNGHGAPTPTALRQWPVQLTLVPPFAPFLRGADILLAADCVPFAHADFHRDLLAGKALLVGCPKLDNLEAYRAKLRQIAEIAQPRSITVAIMEVPCCRGLAMIAQEAAVELGIPIQIRVIGIQGEPLN